MNPVSDRVWGFVDDGVWSWFCGAELGLAWHYLWRRLLSLRMERISSVVRAIGGCLGIERR